MRGGIRSWWISSEGIFEDGINRLPWLMTLSV